MLVVLDLILTLILLQMTIFLTVLMDMNVAMALVGMLHPFHDFFLHRIHMVHHDDHRLVLPVKGIHHLVHPVLHGPAVGDDHIRLLHGADIPWRRLKGMAVHARRNNHRQPDRIPGNLPEKIVIRK